MDKNKKIAVFGATGNLGDHDVRQTLDKGYDLCVLVRNESKFKHRENPKVKVMVGDAAKLEDVASTLEELWMSYNSLKALDDIGPLDNLEVIYLGNNHIEDWAELEKLSHLPKLRDILLVGNPIYEQFEEESERRTEVLKHLPNLAKIDGKMVTPAEREAAKQ